MTRKDGGYMMVQSDPKKLVHLWCNSTEFRAEWGHFAWRVLDRTFV